ncbi:MAG: hypothetical protein ABI353_08910 [Isosphaeraceae bacterium]
MKRKSREFRPAALEGTHQLEDRVVLSQFGAMQIGSFQQSQGISQNEINRGLRDVNRAFTQLSNAYSRAFNASLRTVSGSGQLADSGFNDRQVDLLNQRLLKVVSRLPNGIQDVGSEVTGITDSLRDDLNSINSVNRTDGPGPIADAARSAHDAILSARGQVQGVLQNYIYGGGENGTPPPTDNGPPPTDNGSPPTDNAPPVEQSYWISQSQINRGLRDVNRAFTQLSNAYSHAFNASLRTVDGSGQLADSGFNDHQVDLLNQRLFRVISRVPHAVDDIGSDVTGITDSLRGDLNSIDSVNRASGPDSIAVAARSAHDAILSARGQVQSLLHDYIASGVQDGSFVIR